MKLSARFRLALACAAVCAGAGLPLAAATVPLKAAPPPLTKTQAAQRFVANFQPLPALNATLSPDGKLIAFAFRDGRTTRIGVMEIGHPERFKGLFTVGTDADATGRFSDVREETPLQIKWMHWVTPTRLVIDANVSLMVYSNGWRGGSGVVIGVDADGGNVKTLLTPRDTVAFDHNFSVGGFERLPNGEGGTYESPVPRSPPLRYLGNPRVIDFDPRTPGAVLVRAGDSQRYFIYSLNAHTGRLKILEDEVGVPGWTPLADREGRIRAAINLQAVSDAPLRYQIDKRRGLLRWTALDDVVGTPRDAPGFWVSPGNFFAERSIPVGFADGGAVLYFASNIGRETYGIYGLDLKSGQRTDLAIEDSHFDLIVPSPGGFDSRNPLVYDRYNRELAGVRYTAVHGSTRWLDPVLQEVQATFEASLPGQSIEVQEWDETRNRFLAVAQSPGDPGGVFVFERSTKTLWEFNRRAPWLDAETPHRVIEFAFARPDGAMITGQALVPRFARLREVPVVFVCLGLPWNRTTSEFSPQMRTIADMGFVVVHVNPRGALGFGRKTRDAIASGKWDELQTEDFVGTLDELAQNFHIHTGRAAVLGYGLGGHLALRAVQLHPERFRAAVAINPVVDIGGWIEESKWLSSAARSWRANNPEFDFGIDRRPVLGAAGSDTAAQLVKDFFGGAKALRNPPLLRQPETVTRPVFVLSYPGPDGAPRTFAHLEAKRFANSVRDRGGRAEYAELPTEFQLRLPVATAAVYRQIEDFLNLNVYDYDVKLGPLQEQAPSEP